MMATCMNTLTEGANRDSQSYEATDCNNYRYAELYDASKRSYRGGRVNMNQGGNMKRTILRKF